MFVAWSSLYHIPVTYMDPIKKISHLRPTFLEGPSYMSLPLVTVQKLVHVLASKNRLFLLTLPHCIWNFAMEIVVWIKKNMTTLILNFQGFKRSGKHCSYRALETRFVVVVVVVNLIFCRVFHEFVIFDIASFLWLVFDSNK